MLKELIKSFFTWYIDFIIRKDFSSFTFNKPEVEASKSILLIANHFSWWDGFLMYQLNRLLFKKNFHVMVTEENYKRVAFLKYLGAFPVNKNSKSLRSSLEYAAKLLDDENNLLLIFPQGKLHSNHVNEIQFEKGLIHLVNFSRKNFQYVFSASFVDYFEKRKPAVSCYLKTWHTDLPPDLESITNAYNNHYQTSRQQQNRITV